MNLPKIFQPTSKQQKMEKKLFVTMFYIFSRECSCQINEQTYKKKNIFKDIDNK